ncbi:MAG TPA: hypothetical protein VMB50_19070 [Myxococcales bacterium]|nr:hypothetical protein [Myxococcales bacterium]
MRSRATLAALVLLFAGTGRAATRAFAETYETRTGAQGDGQVESWIDDDAAYGFWDVWRFWWGATAALTDTVEVSAYVVGAQQWTGPSEASLESGQGQPSSGLQLEMLYLMARWRFFGDGKRGLSLMGQLEFCLPVLPALADQQKLPLLSHATVLGERLVASYDAPHFIASANLLFDEAAAFDAPGRVQIGDYSLHALLKWTAGVAYAPFQPGLGGPPFTIGVEAFGDIAARDFNYAGIWAIWWPGAFPAAVGPALSVARGRFWATASLGWTPAGVQSLVEYGDGLLKPTQVGLEGVGRLIAAFEF